MNCSNCNAPFDQHVELPNGNRQCADGGRFDFVFQVNPEVVDFVKENLDKPPDGLAAMWIDRVRQRRRCATCGDPFTLPSPPQQDAGRETYLCERCR